MKRNLIFAVVMVVLSSTIGTGAYYLGKKSTTNNVNTGATVNAVPGVDIEVTTTMSSKSIAIVNQDQGVEYKNTSKNYANDVISAIGSDFVLVDRESAKRGVESGTYGAMIVLPGNFSTNITTINNDTPTKIEVYYEVNKKLDKDSKFLVNAKVQEFEKNLNNKLSYMYVTSIVSEIHTAQDYTNMILENDKLDLEALNAITNIDLLKSINLTDLEDQNIDIENIDLTKNFEENKEIMNQLDNVYRDKLFKSDNNVDSLKQELTTVLNDKDTGLLAFRDKLQNISAEQLKEAIARSHDYVYDELEPLYGTNLDTICDYVEELLKGSLSSVQEKGENSFAKIGESIDGNLESANEILDNANKDSISKLQSITNMSDLSSYNEEYLLYAQMVNELLKQNPELFDKVYTTVSEKGKISYKNIIKNPQGSNTSSNLFTDSNTLKAYLVDNSKMNSDFIANRSEQYENKVTGKIASNKAEGEKIVNQIKAIDEEAQKLKNSNSDLKNDKDYVYLSGLFDKASKETFKSKVSSELLSKENKEKLDSSVKEKNKVLVNDIKKVVENKIMTEGIVDFGKVITTFDNQYVSKIEGISNTVNTFEKTADLQNDKLVLDLWSKSYENNTMLSNSIFMQLDNYKNVTLSSKENAAMHIKSMREYLDGGIKEAEINVNDALSTAKSKKEDTNSINKQKLAMFSKLLSNTRNGSVANGDVYNFIVNPATLKEN